MVTFYPSGNQGDHLICANLSSSRPGRVDSLDPKVVPMTSMGILRRFGRSCGTANDLLMTLIAATWFLHTATLNPSHREGF